MHHIHFRNLTIASIIALVPMFIVVQAQLWPGADMLVGIGSYVGVDFTNYWLGGRLAGQGQIDTLYNLDAYNEHRLVVFSPSTYLFVFSYPPNILPLLVPIGLLPYGPALVVWSIGGIAAFVLAAMNSNSTGRTIWPYILLLIAAPALWNNIFHGQLALWLTALFVLGLRLVPTRPVLGGILIGLLTIKPQLGILLPFLLLSERSWTAIFSAAVTAISLFLVSIIWFGWDAWSLYIENIVPVQQNVVYDMRDRYYGLLSASVYGSFIHAGTSFTVAMAAHLLIAIAVALASLRYLFDDKVGWQLKVAITACATVLLPPYILSYDLAIPAAAIAWYLSTRSQTPSPTPIEQLVFVLAWIVPFGFLMIFNLYHVSIGVLPSIAVFIWLCREGQKESGQSTVEYMHQWQIMTILRGRPSTS